MRTRIPGSQWITAPQTQRLPWRGTGASKEAEPEDPEEERDWKAAGGELESTPTATQLRLQNKSADNKRPLRPFDFFVSKTSGRTSFCQPRLVIRK